MTSVVGNTLVTFWEGDISWMERLCAAAAISTGHHFRIYTYDPGQLQPIFPAAEVLDARTIIPKASVAYQRVMPVARAYFADLFRLELLARGCGVWVDFDELMLKPMTSLGVTSDGYIFGWDRKDLIANGVLYIPPESPFLADAMRLSYAFGKTAPWWPAHKAARRYVQATFEQARCRTLGLPPPVFKKAFMGPQVVTYLARHYGLAGQAQKQTVFYPVHQTDCHLFTDPSSAAVQSTIGSDTVGIHLCHGSFQGGPLYDRVPVSGYFGEACARFEIRDP